jgi:hypothetical protein
MATLEKEKSIKLPDELINEILSDWDSALDDTDIKASIKEALEALKSQGFHLVKEHLVDDKIENTTDFDINKPDFVLVGTEKSPLPNSLLFLHAQSENHTVHAITALDPNASSDLIDKINSDMGFVYQNQSGEPYVGFLELSRCKMPPHEREENHLDFKDSLDAIKELGLKTAKIPMNNTGMSFIPYFSDENKLYDDIGMDGAIKVLKDEIGVLAVNTFDLTEEQKLKFFDDPKNENEISLGMKGLGMRR